MFNYGDCEKVKRSHTTDIRDPSFTSLSKLSQCPKTHKNTHTRTRTHTHLIDFLFLFLVPTRLSQ